MKYFIREEIIKAATSCEKKFSCLAGTRNDLCKVLSCIDSDIHFVHCDNKKCCLYIQKIGEREYCDCPVRKEIYDKYNL